MFHRAFELLGFSYFQDQKDFSDHLVSLQHKQNKIFQASQTSVRTENAAKGRSVDRQLEGSR